MPNKVVEAYRNALAAQGLTDNTPDYYLTQEFGRVAERQNRALFQAAPDFAEEYAQIREANAPSLASEVGSAFKRGARGLVATGLGGAALITDSDYLRQQAAAWDAPAEGDEGPTIATMEDIAPGRSGLGRVFSSDALRYGATQLGAAAPSIIEAVGTSALGGLAGSAVAPGPGTVAGAATGLVSRAAVKSAIRQLLKKGAREGTESVADTLVKRGVIKEASEDAIQGALLAGDDIVGDVVSRQARALAARTGAAAVNTVNSYVLNSGELYNATGDREIASTLGVVAALPDTILPGMVVKRLFPDVGQAAAQRSAKQLVGKYALEALKDTGIEGSTEAFQESVKVVAKNIKDGRDPLTFTEDDWRSIRESAAGGVAGGILAVPGTAMNLRNEIDESQLRAREERTASAAREAAAGRARAEAVRSRAAGFGQYEAPIGPQAPIDEEYAAWWDAAVDENEQAQDYEGLTEQLRRQAAPPPPPEPVIPVGEINQTELSTQPDIPEDVITPVDSAFARERAAQVAQAPISTGEPIVTPSLEQRNTEEFNARILDLTQELTTEGVPIPQARQAARALANASTPEEFTFIREQLKQRFSPQGRARAARERAAQYKTFADLPTITEISGPVVGSPVAAAAEGVPAAVETAPEMAVVETAPVTPVSTGEVVTETALTPEAIAETTPPPAVADIPSTPETLPAAPAKVTPFQFGPVIEGTDSIDFRTDERLTNLTPEQLVQGLPAVVRGIFSTEGSRSKTRAALVFRAPDGHIVQAGITVPQKISDLSGRRHTGTAAAKLFAVQGMAENSRQGGRITKALREGGREPALLTEVISAGYRPIAYVSFDKEPGRIFQTFANEQEFDAAWATSEKSTGKQGGIKRSAAGGVQAAVEQSSAINQLTNIEGRIDEIARQLTRTDRSSPQFETLVNEYRELAERQSELFRIGQNQTGTDELPPNRIGWQAAAPVRIWQFKAALARLQRLGVRIDLFSREVYRKMDPEADAQAVMFTPYHIAMAIDDVADADMNHLTTLIHEAGHTIVANLNDRMRDRIADAAVRGYMSLAQRADEATAANQAAPAELYNAEEALVEAMAQEIAREGVADAPSIAQAIMRFIRDLYMRIAMAIEAGLGRQPNDKMALDWFKNQLSRRINGDYDFALLRFLDRMLPQTTLEQSERVEITGGTPGGVIDFVDPATLQMLQPTASPDTLEGIRWNARQIRRTPTEATPPTEMAPAEAEMSGDEARARIEASAIAEEQRIVEEALNEVGFGPLTPQVWKIIGRGDLPAARLAAISEIIQGAEQARIGDERSTDAMNQQARVTALSLLKKLQAQQVRRATLLKQAADKASTELVELSQQKQILEANLRDAELHERTMRDRLKVMIRSLVRGTKRGMDLTAQQTSLAEAIREAADLSETEAIPEQYQSFMARMLQGSARAGFEGQDTQQVNLFRYLEAVSSLDRDLNRMSMREIIDAIEAETDNPVLVDLAQDRPMMAAVAALARDNAEQLDQIQLGRVRNTTEYLRISKELDEVRTANEVQLGSMMRRMEETASQRGLSERLKARYLKRRAEVKRAQNVIAKSADQSRILREVSAAMQPAIDRIEAEVGAFSEWYPVEGAKWTAMQLQPDGSWKPVERTLNFNNEGTALEADRINHDLVQNWQWIAQNRDQAGNAAYERVKRQTYELRMLDLKAKYPAQHRHLLDRLLQPLGEAAAAAGHSSGARIKQMLLRWQFVIKSHWRSDVEPASKWWTKAFLDAQKATGSKALQDHGTFLARVYDPVLYMLGSEPGLTEDQAIRRAVRMARELLGPDATPASNFNEAFTELLRRTKAANDEMVKVAEQYGTYVADPRLGGQLRRAVNQGWLTVMRRMRADTVQTVTRDMQEAGWKLDLREDTRPDGSTVNEVVRASTFDGLTVDQTANPDQLREILNPLFTPGVIDRWLQPFLNKPGAPLFKWNGKPISQMDVQQAWQDSGGDVVAFMDALAGRLDLGTPTEAIPDPAAAFRLSILRRLDELFGMESKLAFEAAHSRNLFDPQGGRPHVMMDARVNELLPPEHLQHQSFDPQSSRTLLGVLGFHAAFGRNGERMVATLRELTDVLNHRKAQFESLTGTSKASRRLDAEARGLNYGELEKAARNYQDVVGLKQNLEQLFSFSNNGGPLQDAQGGLEMLGFLTSQVVNNPKTGLLNLVSLAERPLVMRSLGSDTIRATGTAYKEFARNVFGSLLEGMGMNIIRASQYAKEIGEVEGRGFGRLPWGVAMAEIGKEGNLQTGWQNNYLIRPLRAIANFQRKGPALPGESNEFGRLNVVPGIGGVIHYLSQEAAVANAQAQVQQFELMVKRGMEYFAAHPEYLKDPTFRFTARDLKMNNRAFFSNEGAYDYWRQKAIEYRVGNLEDVVRDAMGRVETGEPLLNKEQVLALSLMSANELNLESSINTRPAGLASNPILKYGMPLIGWPLAKMNSVHQALKTKDGQKSAVQALKTIATMAMWSLPIGLAFTLWMDEYDEKILGKKSNLTGVDWQAAIPIIGPAWALAAGEKGARQNFTAMLERQAKAGNIYGLGADLFSQIFTPLTDPNSGQRAFSLDQRVMAMSQLLTVQQAITNYINQDGEATYASVYRPLFQALGGNGVLHGVDMVNEFLGLDNQQARMVARTNVGNWLRSAGREVGLELRKAGGGGSPTPVTAWVREMQLASYANDRVGFMDAYRRAIAAAREMGKEDPQKSVLASWRSRNPLEVFKADPTEQELRRLFSVMDPSGQRAVRDSMRLFEEYTELISPSDFQRYMNRSMSRSRPPSIESLRRRAANIYSQ